MVPHPLGFGDEVLEVEGAPSRYYDDFARILTSLFKATSSMQFVDRKFFTVNDKLIFRFGQIPPVSLQDLGPSVLLLLPPLERTNSAGVPQTGQQLAPGSGALPVRLFNQV